MTSEFTTYLDRENDKVKRVKETQICTSMSLMDFLKMTAKCGVTQYCHTRSKTPGKDGASFGSALGVVKAIISDGVINSLEESFTYNGIEHHYFRPIFEGATYVAQIKIPPSLEEGDLVGIKHGRYAPVIIVSNTYTKDVRKIFRKAGIPLASLIIN